MFVVGAFWGGGARSGRRLTAFGGFSAHSPLSAMEVAALAETLAALDGIGPHRGVPSLLESAGKQSRLSALGCQFRRLFIFGGENSQYSEQQNLHLTIRKFWDSGPHAADDAFLPECQM